MQALNVGESEASEEIPPLGALPISKEVWSSISSRICRTGTRISFSSFGMGNGKSQV